MLALLGTLIGIILLVVVLGYGWWAIQRLIGLVPLAEPFKTILHVLLVGVLVIVVIWAIVVGLGFVGVHVPFFGAMGHLH
jgi:hypothetical protein